MKHLIFVSAVAAVLLGTNDASGWATMRCGSGLISTGDSKVDVISKCGVPDLKEVVALNTIGVDFRRGFRTSTSAVEAWHYNCGEGRFNKTLYFDGGTLSIIQMSNSRGSGPERCN